MIQSDRLPWWITLCLALGLFVLLTGCGPELRPAATCHFGDLSIAGVMREYPGAGMLPVAVSPLPVEGASYVHCTIPGVVQGEVGTLADRTPFYASEDLRLYTIVDEGSTVLMGEYRALR